MMGFILKRLIIGLTVSGFCLITSSLQAANHAVKPKNDQEQGVDIKKSTPAIKSKGNVEINNPNTSEYWFKLTGNIRLDQTFFIGDSFNKKNDFPNGAQLRAAEFSLNGGIGQFWSYKLTLGFTPGPINVSDAYVLYNKFKSTDHHGYYVALGNVPSTFSLENTNSGKWFAFLERSLPAATFSPDFGLGVNGTFWWQDVSFIATLVQPPIGAKTGVQYGNKSDRLSTSGRLVFAPVRTTDRVYQIGVSGTFQSVAHLDNTPSTLGQPFADLGFKVLPEARSRNINALLNTSKMVARNYTAVGIEGGLLVGSLHLKTDYIRAHVTRVGNPNVSFKGYDVLGRYVLTGEIPEYDFPSGTFGKITPTSPNGAWEVAARYSFINLNDKDIRGGREHNAGISLGWYINSNCRIFANLIRANIHPANDAAKRKVDILGTRLQVIW